MGTHFEQMPFNNHGLDLVAGWLQSLGVVAGGAIAGPGANGNRVLMMYRADPTRILHVEHLPVQLPAEPFGAKIIALGHGDDGFPVVQDGSHIGTLPADLDPLETLRAALAGAMLLGPLHQVVFEADRRQRFDTVATDVQAFLALRQRRLYS